MKKVKILLVMLLLAFVVPFTVNAEEENATAGEVTKKEITVYMFRGEGCGFCEKALTFFESIEEEYGQYFELVTYEVWNSVTNQELMQDVGVYLNKSISGVPFIIIGETTFGGFQDSWGDQIKEAIMTEYNKSEEERIDVVEKAKNKEDNNDVIIAVVTLVIVVGGAIFVYYARKTDAKVVLEEKVVEEVKVEELKKEEPKKTKVQNKKTDGEVKKTTKKEKETETTKKNTKKTSENKDNKKKSNAKPKTQKQKK